MISSHVPLSMKWSGSFHFIILWSGGHRRSNLERVSTGVTNLEFASISKTKKWCRKTRLLRNK